MNVMVADDDDDDDRPWDERADEEYSGGQVAPRRTCRSVGRKRRGGRAAAEELGAGDTHYPIDIWFLISESIRPEDVGRFAAICQTTYYVTTTARFWFAMYRRYYEWTCRMPEDLRYWNVDKVDGLRAAVIRSLYHVYRPFTQRLAREKPLGANPDCLLQCQCVGQWHVVSKKGSVHRYFFKFYNPSIENFRSSRLNFPKSQSDALVSLNREDGCYLLEAKTNSICRVRMVMGQYLYHAGLGVSSNFLHHRLRLSLGPSYLLCHTSSTTTRKYQAQDTEIMLDPVVDMRVYPWWHPEYYNILSHR